MRELLYTVTGIIFIGGVITGYTIKDFLEE
jgi:hypothetical protein